MPERLGRTSLAVLASALVLVLVFAPLASSASAAAAPAALERITLGEAVARALAQNPSATVARQEIERADAFIKQARAAELPFVGATGSYIRNDSARVNRGATITQADQLTANAVVTVPLVAPLAWAGVHRAEDARDVARASDADVRRQLAAAVARAYLGVVLQRRQLDVAGRARDTARAHHEFARARLVGGVGTSLDAVRAEQELRGDEAQVASAQAALARAQAALAILLSSDRPVDVVDDVVLEAPADPAAAAAGAQAARADVNALAMRRAAAARARHDVWALYAPFLGAGGLVFAQRGSAFQPERGWQAQLVLTLPIYDGGARSGVARERDALTAEATLQLEAALRQVATEVRTAFDVLARADEGLAASRQAAELARRAAGLADLAYRAGATTNIEVIDAERRARDAETQAALAEDASRQARLDLLLATGRFP